MRDWDGDCIAPVSFLAVINHHQITLSGQTELLGMQV